MSKIDGFNVRKIHEIVFALDKYNFIKTDGLGG